MGDRAVLFDVDGTLTDTNYLHTLAWWRALTDAGHDVAMASVHRLIGMGASELLTELIGHDDEAVSKAHGQHYQRMKGEIRPLPGAPRLLEEVAGRGAAVVLATSAKARDLDDLLRALAVTDVIDHVIHAADVENAKPAGDIFASALDAADCSAGEAIVIGDTRWDVEAAGRVDLGVVAVETGGWGRLELLEAGALSVFRDAADLLDHLDDSPVGTLLAR
jgi:HAD superfamily hydrolase (TIGR01509 family)